MKLRSLEYIIQEAFTGIYRNGLMAFASISTVALSLGVLGAFVLTALGANHFATTQIDRFEIAVFVKNAMANEIGDITNTIKKMDGVQTITTLDRDKEWAELKRQRPDIESAGLPLNPLPYTLNVKIKDHSRTAIIATKIRTMNGIDAVREGREVKERVMALAQVVNVVSIAGVIILLITTVFIISNAIKLTLYARRREIRTMQLVGATNQFIRLPLVIEGIFFGAAGALAAWLLLHVGSSYLSHVANRITSLTGQLNSGINAGALAFWLVVLGSAIGAAGSLVSIRRFLHD